jgi:hypothetical protein
LWFANRGLDTLSSAPAAVLRYNAGRVGFSILSSSRVPPALIQIARLQRVVLTPAVAAQFLATSANDGSEVISFHFSHDQLMQGREQVNISSNQVYRSA